LQTVSLPFEETNKTEIGLWLDVDGGNLLPIETIVACLLTDGILQEEERLKATEPGFGNKLSFHVPDEDMDILLLEAEVEARGILKDRSMRSHPLHGISVRVQEGLGNSPVRKESSHIQSDEVSSLFEGLDIHIVLPESLVVVPFSIQRSEELRLVVVVDQADVLVLEHERSEEEAALVVLVNDSQIPILLINR